MPFHSSVYFFAPYSAADWNDTTKMESAFAAAFPNQDTTFLAQEFASKGQIVIVSGISATSVDPVTFLVITLSHLFMQTPPENEQSSPVKAIVLKGWPYSFVGMGLESGGEVRFAVDTL